MTAKKAYAHNGKTDGGAAVLAKIAVMQALQPTVWYGMPRYAKASKTVCFFRADKNT
jgi:hypothetical protein